MTKEPIFNTNAVTNHLRNQHKEYMARYRAIVEKSVNDRHLERVTTYSRLKLLSTSMMNAKVICEARGVDVIGYRSSIALLTEYDVTTYLLNDCTSVIVASANTAWTDALSNRISIVNTGRGTFDRYDDVLNPEFNWEKFAMKVLDSIHRGLVSQEDLVREIFSVRV